MLPPRTVSLGHVVDQLHDEHSLAHTRTTEETNLATTLVGSQQVHHLQPFAARGKMNIDGSRSDVIVTRGTHHFVRQTSVGQHNTGAVQLLTPAGLPLQVTIL